MRFFKYLLIAPLLISSLVSCTSMQAIRETNTVQQILESVSPGDLINVETVDGTKQEILVKSITKKSLKSETVEIPLDDIVNIKKEKISILKTAGAILSGQAIAGTIIALLVVAF